MITLLNENACQSIETMGVINPFNGTEVARVDCASVDQVDSAVARAVCGFEANRSLTTGQRSAILHKTAEYVAVHSKNFAVTITSETGKPITAARKEVNRCVNTLHLAAEEATRKVGETINFDSFAGGENRNGYYLYEPLGVIVAITPFNDPLNLVAHKLGPAIAAGNAVVLKPSAQAPLSAMMLVEALIESGLPEDIVNVLTGSARDFGNQLTGHPDVSMITFTGGDKAGEAIAKSAGAKKLSMELGANSPVIVTGDCDLEHAAKACVSGAFWAVGQNCIGVQRIFVHDNVYEDFKQRFVDLTNQLTVGDPMDEATDIGPMIGEDEAIRVEQWVDETVSLGGKVLTGGVRKGAIYYPTVFEQTPSAAPVVCSEVFGPVVSLFRYEDISDAIAQANKPDYMIHAAIFTNNLQTAFRATQELQCAGVMVNDSTDYRLDAMPFGGAKKGSMGREGVKYAIHEMMQTKTVCFNFYVPE